MSKTCASVTELKEEEDDVLSAAISKSLQIEDDFVWIEKTSSPVISIQNHLDSSRETAAEIVNIAQHDTKTGNSGSAEEYLPECNAEDTENRAVTPSEWEKEVLVDQQYWEQYEYVNQKENSARAQIQIQYPVSQRLTVSQSHYIENGKLINREPSYYKLGIPTTATLNTIIEKKYVGPMHNVLGKGNNSVVIFARSPYNNNDWDRAVKVYKLSNDVKKNNAIYRRTQREYDHLFIFRYYSSLIPRVTHRLKNVLVFSLIGKNQESYPSLSSLAFKHSELIYQIVIKHMKMWYTKHNLVHGKLCSKNILIETTVLTEYHWCDGLPCHPFFIGWGHSVKRDHPRALSKLMRDCHFVTNFFERREVPVKSTQELFKDITELEEISSKVLSAITPITKSNKDLWQTGHLTNPNRRDTGHHDTGRILRNEYFH